MPMPAPEPPQDLDERLADLAALVPNACRSATPGFEALGGWARENHDSSVRSRLYIRDLGPFDGGSHGADVWKTFTDCAEGLVAVDGARQYGEIPLEGRIQPNPDAEPWLAVKRREHGTDILNSASVNDAEHYLSAWHDARAASRVLTVAAAGNQRGRPTADFADAEGQFGEREGLAERLEDALYIVVAGYAGEGGERRPAERSSVCSETTRMLCLFAPWEGPAGGGTSFSAPQAAAALDAVWSIWPDMDAVDLRNLAFDCAENMPAPEGQTTVTESLSYTNGRSFSSQTSAQWGHGILSLACLFTPNGGLRNPATGEPLSGGIFGPLSGPVVGALAAGADYTGRSFGYGFARPARAENWALKAAMNAGSAQAGPALPAAVYGAAFGSGSLARRGRLRLDLAAAGNALAVSAQSQASVWILRAGLAIQPEGAGSLAGARSFRAPAVVSAALRIGYARPVSRTVTVWLGADHWRAASIQPRSLWEDADLAETRLTAAFTFQAASHQLTLQGVWQSGLRGRLTVSGRPWILTPRPQRALWLTWRHAAPG